MSLSDWSLCIGERKRQKEKSCAEQSRCSTLTDPSFCILTFPGPDILLGASADDAPAAAAAEELPIIRCPFASVLQHW
ncbi:hypothetical protein EYF80_016849 [Liparis tanakae]|uniref:Uncharacterized protein n=1 Tax=Liparis tanakae TaxID=230148 RepID=A0A4Z2I516_9TELE|nr:hypothetical protein EYF80_016849 [Liparis tanakae]